MTFALTEAPAWLIAHRSLLILWLFFNLFALGLLLLDLRFVHRRARVVGYRGAFLWTALYIAMAAAFAAALYFWQGRQTSLEFITAYVLELSLSVDNLFLFLVIFRYFAVPDEQQHRVLFWGIAGALILRGIFIVGGVSLIHRFHWLFLIFGALLIYSGIRLSLTAKPRIDPAANPLVKTLQKFVPVTAEYQGSRFFIRMPGESDSPRSLRLYATPLVVVLLVLETTDVLFAADSIPAALSITLNAFIVYAANVFAILALRSMYFAVSGLMRVFRFLRYGLALVLVMTGVKMMGIDRFNIPTIATLAAVAAVLLIAIALSLVFPRSNER
jgi:tellurite resistance protein TerC